MNNSKVVQKKIKGVVKSRTVPLLDLPAWKDDGWHEASEADTKISIKRNTSTGVTSEKERARSSAKTPIKTSTKTRVRESNYDLIAKKKAEMESEKDPDLKLILQEELKKLEK